ncbi:MAG: PIN domain nuclease [Ekhidna sp.]
MICDTSVWINFFNRKGTWQENVLSHRIRENLPVYICPIIIQEVLQGVRHEVMYGRILGSLLDFQVLSDNWLQMSLDAALLYRELRKKGITIRKPNDCLIASYSIHYSLPILHQDKDFDQIAKHTSLKVYAK